MRVTSWQFLMATSLGSSQKGYRYQNVSILVPEQTQSTLPFYIHNSEYNCIFNIILQVNLELMNQAPLIKCQ